MTRYTDGGGGSGFSTSFGPNPTWLAKPSTSFGPNKKLVKKTKPHPPQTAAKGRSYKPVQRTTQPRNYQPAPRNSQPRNYQPAGRTSQPRNYGVPRPPVGNTPAGTVAASVPKPISEADYLAGDTAFQSQQNAYTKALTDYANQMAAEKNKYTGEYDAQVKQLGLDRTNNITDLRDDYASRGLVNSGVFGDALGDLNTKFDTSAADLARAKQAYLDDLTTGQTNFKTTQQTLLEKARQEALQRRLDSMRG